MTISLWQPFTFVLRVSLKSYRNVLKSAIGKGWFISWAKSAYWGLQPQKLDTLQTGFLSNPSDFIQLSENALMSLKTERALWIFPTAKKSACSKVSFLLLSFIIAAWLMPAQRKNWSANYVPSRSRAARWTAVSNNRIHNFALNFIFTEGSRLRR